MPRLSPLLVNSDAKVISLISELWYQV